MVLVNPKNKENKELHMAVKELIAKGNKKNSILNFIIYVCLFLTIVHLSLFIFVSQNYWYLVCCGLGIYVGVLTIFIKRMSEV